MKLTFNYTIIEKLAELFYLPGEETINATKQFESSFFCVQNKPCDGFSIFEKPEAATFFTEAEKEKWKAATLIGLDMPVLISGEGPSCKRVIIIGIDPLRKRKDFPLVDSSLVIAGTPYAVHSSFYREKGNRTKVYWNFISGLAEQYDIYLTDIYKLWMNDAAIGENIQFAFNASIEAWRTLLKFEIKTIAPSIIIYFGNTTAELCKDFESEFPACKIITLPHPSGRNKRWSKLIEGRGTVDAKVDYLLKQMGMN